VLLPRREVSVAKLLGVSFLISLFSREFIDPQVRFTHDVMMNNSSDALEISRVSDEHKPGEDVATGVVDDEEAVYEIDPAVEKNLRRKLDRRLITLVFLAYLLAFLDRSNVGNAETAGMGRDLGFGDDKYQVCEHS
jgi:hypothetical protein